MSMYYAAGDSANLLTRGTVTCNPAQDAKAPLPDAYDGTPAPFRFGTLVADSYIQLRNNFLAEPSFETVTGTIWIDADTGTGASAQSPVGAGRGGAGTFALRCNGGAAGVGQRYQVKEVRAGEHLFLDGWINAAIGDAGELRVYNPLTGHWLVSGSWQAAPGDAVSVAGNGAYQQVALTTFEVESLEDCLAAEVDLWVYCRTDENADVDFDDIVLGAAVNGAALFGDNLTTCLTVTLRYSDDGFTADDNLAATITLSRPSSYCYLTAAVYREWWRIKLGGTPAEIPRVAEIWIGYLEAPTRGPSDGWKMAEQPIVSEVQDPHSSYRNRTGDRPATRLEFDFTTWDASEWRAFLTDVKERTYMGHEQLLLIPSTVALEARAVLGRPDRSELVMTRTGRTWRQSLTLHGMRFPRWTP